MVCPDFGLIIILLSTTLRLESSTKLIVISDEKFHHHLIPQLSIHVPPLKCLLVLDWFQIRYRQEKVKGKPGRLVGVQLHWVITHINTIYSRATPSHENGKAFLKSQVKRTIDPSQQHGQSTRRHSCCNFTLALTTIERGKRRFFL